MLTEPSTPLNDADHAGSSNYLEDTHFMGDELKKHQPALTIDEQVQVRLQPSSSNFLKCSDIKASGDFFGSLF